MKFEYKYFPYFASVAFAAFAFFSSCCFFFACRFAQSGESCGLSTGNSAITGLLFSSFNRSLSIALLIAFLAWEQDQTEEKNKNKII